MHVDRHAAPIVAIARILHRIRREHQPVDNRVAEYETQEAWRTRLDTELRYKAQSVLIGLIPNPVDVPTLEEARMILAWAASGVRPFPRSRPKVGQWHRITHWQLT